MRHFKQTHILTAVRLGLLLAGVLLSASRCENLPGDDFACTEMACSDRLDIAVSHSGGGDYTGGNHIFTVTPAGAESLTLSCEVEEGESFDECTGEFSGDYFLSASGDGQTIALVLEGGWGQLDAETVELTVVIDETTAGEETLAPTWSENYPNGEECDDLPCYQAAESVEL